MNTPSNTSLPLGFKPWLLHYSGPDLLIHDLAHDAKDVHDWPRGKMTRKRLLRYLRSCDACDGAIVAAKRAWHEYKLYRVGHEAVSQFEAMVAERIGGAL